MRRRGTLKKKNRKSINRRKRTLKKKNRKSINRRKRTLKKYPSRFFDKEFRQKHKKKLMVAGVSVVALVSALIFYNSSEGVSKTDENEAIENIENIENIIEIGGENNIQPIENIENIIEIGEENIIGNSLHSLQDGGSGVDTSTSSTKQRIEFWENKANSGEGSPGDPSSNSSTSTSSTSSTGSSDGIYTRTRSKLT